MKSRPAIITFAIAAVAALCANPDARAQAAQTQTRQEKPRIQVYGKVMDYDHSPVLKGLSVVRIKSGGNKDIVDSDGNHVFTEEDGSYTIVASPGDTLIFDCFGHERIEMAVSENDNTIDVVLPKYDGEIGHTVLPVIRGHYIYLETVASPGKWGYGFGYQYRVPYTFSRRFLRRMWNYVGPGIQLVHRNPGSSRWTINPHLWLDTEYDNALKRRKIPIVCLNAGYAFDTDFHSVERGQFAYGVEVRLRQLPRFMSFKWRVQLVAGYSAFARTPENNYWRLGVRIRLN